MNFLWCAALKVQVLHDVLILLGNIKKTSGGITRISSNQQWQYKNMAAVKTSHQTKSPKVADKNIVGTPGEDTVAGHAKNLVNF